MNGGDINNNIWIFWKSSISVFNNTNHEQFIYNTLVKSGMRFNAFFVYSSCSAQISKDLWAGILAATDNSESIIIGGYFNVVTEENVKLGKRGINRKVVGDFNNFIADGQLIDADFTGSKFTWCNNFKYTQPTWARLDRVLVNCNFLQTFAAIQVTNLTRSFSDHSSLVITAKPFITAKSVFKFSKMWLMNNEFLHLVQANWKYCNSDIPPMVHFSNNL